MFSKRITWRLVLALAMLGPAAAYVAWHKKPVVLAQVRLNMQQPTAFTVVLSERLEAPGRNPFESQRITVMHSAAGDVRYETIGTNHKDIRIERADGVLIRMFPDLGAKRTINLPPSEYAQLRSSRLDPSSNCVNSMYGTTSTPQQVVATETIQGLTAYKIVRKLGDQSETVWRAPALGCADIKRVSVFPQQSYSRLDLVSYTLGEPAPQFFEADMNFTEMKPTDVERLRMKQKFPTATQAMIDNHLRSFMKLDEHYAKYHKAN